MARPQKGSTALVGPAPPPPSPPLRRPAAHPPPPPRPPRRQIPAPPSGGSVPAKVAGSKAEDDVPSPIRGDAFGGEGKLCRATLESRIARADAVLRAAAGRRHARPLSPRGLRAALP